jgi:ABC-type lipoprotein release transport system permease subunit
MHPWIEKQRYFIDFTISSLVRRKGKNLSLLFVYSLMVFVLSSAMFFSNAIRREAANLLKDAPEIMVQRVVAGRHDLVPVGYVEEIARIRGARTVKARLWGYYYHPASRSTYTIMAPEGFSHGDDSIEVGSGVLRTWGAGQQNQVFFKAHDGEPVALKVVKTFDPATELVAADLILMSEKTFRKISGISEGFATDISLEARNPKEWQTLAEKIVQALPDTRPILREEILRTYASLFDWRGGYIIVLLSGAILAFFIFAWDKATGLSGEERTELGILKGLGWDTADILVMKFWEGAVSSLTAFLLGVLAAYLHVFFTSAPLFHHALKGWSTLYPEFRLSPAINAFQIAVMFFLTVVPYTFITIIPTWRVAVTDPDAIMRQA